MYIVVDIHGVIANQNHREHLRGKIPWEQFYSHAANDKPYTNTINLINNLSSVGYKILGVTGTPEKFRHIITEWLDHYKVNIELLLMRHTGDYSKTCSVKVKLIRDYFNESFKDVHFVIDDGDEEAIQEFTELGIAILQLHNAKEI